MKLLLTLLTALTILAGSAIVHAQPVSFTAKYGTDLPGQGWSPFAPKFSKRQSITAPANTVAPVASGTARVGQTLTTTSGTWTGSPTFTYQWRRDGINIGSATNSTYVLVTADLGTAIDCNVTATNAAGAVTQDSNNITVGSDLSAVLASAVFDLDATKAASYSGSGTTWANLVTDPADGSAQTAYDFITGDGVTSTLYPTFNGSGAAAYFGFDGGDYFNLKSGTNTAFLKALHKSTGGQDFAFAAAFRLPNGGSQALAGTNAGGTAAGGWKFGTPSADDFQYLRTNANATFDLLDTNSVIADGTDRLMIFTYRASDRSYAVYNNTSTPSASGTAASYTATADPTYPMQIGAAGNAAQLFENTSRLYSFAFFNEYFDNTKAAAIIAALEARHGRDYTP